MSCQGGIEFDDMESVDSSIPSNHDSKVKNLKGVRKAIKSFGSTRSFRRGRSRIMKPTAIQSPCCVDTSDSSPNHMKVASCCEGKKGHFRASPRCSESSFDSSDQSSQSNMASSSVKSFQTLMRSSSLRSLRVSFKSRKRSVKLSPVDTATCSSTIKNSKFPEKVELLPGQAESERISVYRVCSYHHCSLNGHSHDSSSTPPKRVQARRRWSTSKKITKPRNEYTATKELIPVEPLMHKGSSPEAAISVTDDSSVRENSQSYAGISGGCVDADLVEIIFGETSFPEKNYQETLYQIGKTANWCCSCNSSKANVDSEEFRENKEEMDSKSEPDSLPVKSTPAGELDSKNLPQVVDSEAKSSPLKEANKEKPLSMWNLIHHNMVSCLAAGSNNKPSNGSDEANHVDDSNKLPAAPDSCDADVATADQDGGENQEIEVRKLFAIKLVREAIEKILLPEVPDQSSDDQSITSEANAEQEILENNKDNGMFILLAPISSVISLGHMMD